jgi:hypothetical protein
MFCHCRMPAGSDRHLTAHLMHTCAIIFTPAHRLVGDAHMCYHFHPCPLLVGDAHMCYHFHPYPLLRLSTFTYILPMTTHTHTLFSHTHTLTFAVITNCLTDMTGVLLLVRGTRAKSGQRSIHFSNSWKEIQTASQKSLQLYAAQGGSLRTKTAFNTREENRVKSLQTV